MPSYSIHFYNKIQNQIQEIANNKNIDILDFGCGNCENLAQIMTIPNVSVYGCDTKNLNNPLKEKFIHGSLENISSIKFDIVTSGLFCVNFNYRNQFFEDLSKVLKNDGKAFIHLYETTENGYPEIEEDITSKAKINGFNLSKESINSYGKILTLNKS